MSEIATCRPHRASRFESQCVLPWRYPKFPHTDPVTVDLMGVQTIDVSNNDYEIDDGKRISL